MKQIPLLLLESLQKPGKSTCFLVKIDDREGNTHGFTTLDRIVRADDGEGMLTYQPDQELRPQNLQFSAGMDVDNTDLLGWFSPEIEKLVVAGKFSMARITIYRVSYLRLSYGMEVVAFGTVGEIEYAANKQGKRKIEYRSLTQQLRQTVSDAYSLTCRTDFGDEFCKMPLVWEPAIINAVDDQFLRFRIAGVVRPDNWFTLGVIRFDTGNNTGAELEVESWTEDGWVTLSFVTPYAVVNNVQVSIRQDCDKTWFNCYAYNNMVNMRAEHLTPVQDQSLMVPGAYIKSQNAL